MPKVFRNANFFSSSGFLCRPDGIVGDQCFLAQGETGINSYVSPDVASYIPRLAPCANHTSRMAPYARQSMNYTALHPEEAAWSAQRLNKIAPAIQSFVASQLSGKSLSDTQARLKVAFANVGGGKRAMLHSLGEYQHAFVCFKAERGWGSM